MSARPQADKRLKRLPTIKDFTTENFIESEETEIERKNRHQILYDAEPILKIKNLNKSFKINSSFFKKSAYFKAIDDVSFEVYQGEKLGVVGESGCGKTTWVIL